MLDRGEGRPGAGVPAADLGAVLRWAAARWAAGPAAADRDLGPQLHEEGDADASPGPRGHGAGPVGLPQVKCEYTDNRDAHHRGEVAGAPPDEGCMAWVDLPPPPPPGGALGLRLAA